MASTCATLTKKAMSVTAGLALAAGTLAAAAPVASAAPGDRATFATGAGARGIAEDSSGALWITNTGSNSISKVRLDGTTITYASPIFSPFEIVAGPDGNMWFTSGTNQMGYILPTGAVQAFNVGNPTTGIALGPDGNMWFNMPGANPARVGKVTPTGAITTYETGGVQFDFITAGPEGSNRMYVASSDSGSLGIVQMNGQFSAITGPPGSVSSNNIALINGQIWFIPVQANGTAKLTRLINDSGFVQVENAALPAPFYIGEGFDGTMWVADFTETISHVTTGGAVVSTYGTGANVRQALQAMDGNVWATVGDGVTRILTGVVPTSSAAPTIQYPSAAIEPPVPPTAGTSMTATNGTWKYMPTSYAYQWQACTSTDVGTCADIAGATGQSYTIATTDVGKYIRVGVTATNLNGVSQPAYSGQVGTGSAAPPTPNPTPTPATGNVAAVGNGVTMELEAPTSQKRGKRAWYEVVFSATDTVGTVTYTITKGARTVNKTVTVEDGIAEYRWKAPRKWRKGRTTVTAVFIPAAGSPYTSATVLSRVRIR